MEKIKQFESGIEISGSIYKFFVIYGCYDKPARSVILNTQSCAATYACTFCLAKCARVNRKQV